MSASRYFDQLAITLSAVCIVHCLGVPLLVAFLPLAAAAFGGDGHFHELMLWLVLPTSVLGFGFGYRIHRRIGIVVLGAVGVSVIAVAALWGHAAWATPIETLVSVLGSFALALAHWWNFRDVRRLHRHAQTD